MAVRPGSEADKAIKELIEAGKKKLKQEATKGLDFAIGKGKEYVMSHLGKMMMKL
jgi:hypothetical protein